jgi:hypothetical protein
MPRALTDEEWKKVAPSIQAESGSSGGGGDEYSPPVQGALNFGKGLGYGAAKGVASMIPESIEGKGWKDWSGSPGDPTSQAEQWGETGGDIAANVAPFMLVPELGVGTKLGQLAAKVGPRAATWATRAGRAIEDTAKGAFGGGSEAAVHNEEVKDPNQFIDRTKRGAVEGGVSSATLAAGRMAYEALTPAMKHLLHAGATVGGGVLAIDRAGGHHWIPHWLAYGLGGLVGGTAAAASKLKPAVAGAGYERALQGAGYEQTDKTGYSVTKDDGSGDYIETPSR